MAWEWNSSQDVQDPGFLVEAREQAVIFYGQNNLIKIKIFSDIQTEKLF